MLSVRVLEFFCAHVIIEHIPFCRSYNFSTYVDVYFVKQVLFMVMSSILVFWRSMHFIEYVLRSCGDQWYFGDQCGFLVINALYRICILL